MDYGDSMAAIRGQMMRRDSLSGVLAENFVGRLEAAGARKAYNWSRDSVLAVWQEAYDAGQELHLANWICPFPAQDTLSVTIGLVDAWSDRSGFRALRAPHELAWAGGTPVRWLVIDTGFMHHDVEVRKLDTPYLDTLRTLTRSQLATLVRKSRLEVRSPSAAPPRLSALLHPELKYSVGSEAPDGYPSARLEGYRKFSYTDEQALESDSDIVEMKADWKDFQDLRFLVLWDGAAYGHRNYYAHRPSTADAEDTLLNGDRRYPWLQKRMPYKTVYENGLEIRMHHYVEEVPREHTIAFRQVLLINALTRMQTRDVVARPHNH